MSRRPKPWFRKGRGWFVQIDGTQHNLGRNKKEAYQRFHELMSQPPPTPVRGEHVAVLLDLFLEWTKSHRALRTYQWYRERLQCFVQSLPNSLRAPQLRPYHVQQWVDAHPGWSDTHKRGSITAVQRAFSWGTKMGYLDSSPVAHMDKPTAGQREIFITPGEYQQILRHVHDEEFRDLVSVSWETGCRPQESLAVEARHVAPEKRLLSRRSDPGRGGKRNSSPRSPRLPSRNSKSENS